jgi:hypothetical protein
MSTVHVLENGMMNMGIELYNKIPNKIREEEKMRKFKRELRSYFFFIYVLLWGGMYVQLKTVCL